jgi:hypothetical protein
LVYLQDLVLEGSFLETLFVDHHSVGADRQGKNLIEPSLPVVAA